MYKKILIATDGSDLAGKAVDHGLALAKELGATVVIVSVIEPWPLSPDMQPFGKVYNPDEYEKDALAYTERLFTSIEEKAQKLGVSCSSVHLSNEYPSDAIMRVAEDKHCDLIVMASHGRRALGRFFLGSETLNVLSHCKVPVLVCR